MIKAIITGSTGMVGEGVLHCCLNDPRVENVLVINRKPCGYDHPKLKEIIHQDFFDLSSIQNELAGYNACYFCLGVSSVGMKLDKYTKLTYDLTMHFANTVKQVSSDLCFCYVSGEGTDGTERKKGWASVKGRTENEIINLGFKDAYALRPGYIQPIKGLKNTHGFYTFTAPFYSFWKLVLGNYVIRMEEVAECMMQLTTKGSSKKVLSNKEMVQYVEGKLQ